ncbi:YicC/YloC family endoribonuclease [Blochmannia endosymbiont of Polyrhachis (Hedomyrma) turneri]|uniref:YicC/YloC family endoribonuclease n=1 Tax=Blochmannia endosymbiont of Polyrhachis (Hedomyrma) turneri TaxID=1505596 RepID=UPI00061A55E1|nr:YicC/YloC family endoribonuclease [Blochmannia endosymbiont of Polyrhachis (Hedomyrma) turneri]AKC60168.1 UPF0701 protein yicC [Blochmannia endosymbiont of Polyrhachis (Hedomyrma) turneri]
MIRSMTAFIKEEIQHENFTGSWEIRSVNQRYLEIHIYLPEHFRNLETKIRTLIINTPNITRGRIECKLHIYTYYENEQNTINLNNTLIKNLIESIKKIHYKKNINKIDPIKILSWPGVIIHKKINNEINYPIIIGSCKTALCKLITLRELEGSALKPIIEHKLSKIQTEINNIKKELPNSILYQKQKILKKITDINITIDNKRFEEEILLYTQRIDIAEEIDRIEIHIKNTISTLLSEQVIGRKLDFIMQELYKETNTISAKSTNIKIIQSSIEIKILIDQIREQIQNIE